MHYFGQINDILVNDVNIVEILKKSDLKAQNN
jgi:hypothetical protein